MVLKQITDKNFLPAEGVKAIPVYSFHFNEAYDVMDRLNARDHHSMDTVKVVKHPLMAVGVYDFSVNGGATGTLNLNNTIAIIPDNAVVRNVSYDIPTGVTTVGATATMIFKMPTDGTLLTLSNIGTAAAAATGIGLGTPQVGTGGTWLKTTAARGLQIEVTGAGTVITGKVYLFIEYVVSELDSTDYAIS